MRRVSLRYRLPATYGMVALLTMLLVGAILLLLLNNYYAGSERDYLKAGAARAARELSSVDWATVAKGGTPTVTTFAEQRTKAVALATQLRVVVLTTGGATLADSGSPGDIDPSTIVPAGDGAPGTGNGQSGAPGDNSGGPGGLPSPLGSGLFGGDGANVPRSSQVMEQPLVVNGQQVATLRLSEGPAYGAAVLHDTFIGWLLAGLVAGMVVEPAAHAAAHPGDGRERQHGSRRPDRSRGSRPRGRDRQAGTLVQHHGEPSAAHGVRLAAVRCGCRSRAGHTSHGA